MIVACQLRKYFYDLREGCTVSDDNSERITIRTKAIGANLKVAADTTTSFDDNLTFPFSIKF